MASLFINCDHLHICICICICICKYNLLISYNVACTYVFRADLLALGNQLVCSAPERIIPPTSRFTVHVLFNWKKLRQPHSFICSVTKFSQTLHIITSKFIFLASFFHVRSSSTRTTIISWYNKYSQVVQFKKKISHFAGHIRTYSKDQLSQFISLILISRLQF